MLTHRKRIKAVVPWLLIGVAVAVLYLTVGRKLVALLKRQDVLQTWIHALGAAAPIALIGLMSLQVVVAILPGEPIEIGAGYAFGMWKGLLFCLIGAAIGSVVIFWVTRKYGTKVVERFVPLEKIRQLTFLQNNRRLNVLVFLLFWMPGVPKDVLTYVIGLTEMKLTTFLVLSTVARIPSALMSTSGGAALGSGQTTLAAWIFGLSVALGVIGAIYYGKLIRKEREKKRWEDRAKAKQQALRAQNQNGLAAGRQKEYNGNSGGGT